VLALFDGGKRQLSTPKKIASFRETQRCVFSNSVHGRELPNDDDPRRLEQATDDTTRVHSSRLWPRITSRPSRAAFAVRVAGFPARRQKFPSSRLQGNTPRRTPERGRTEESGPTRKPDSRELPVSSL
jgi:hypothetical protein